MNEEQQLYYYKDGTTLLVAKHELDETEIGNYIQITEEEYNNYQSETPQAEHQKSEVQTKKVRIGELKSLLKESDYQAIKYAEGWLTEQEYAPIKTLRQSYRDEINQLEQEIENEL